MRFWPCPSTQMCATPVWVSKRSTDEVSICESLKFCRLSSPKPSLPIPVIIVTRAPVRAAITAWFAPFPPNPVVKLSPNRVSPAAGKTSA